MKRWLVTCNEEGITGLDGLCMGIGVLLAYLIPIVLSYI